MTASRTSKKLFSTTPIKFNKLFVVKIDLSAFKALNILFGSYQEVYLDLFRKPADVQLFRQRET